MKKYLILIASVSALALAGCSEKKAEEKAPEAPKAEQPAQPAQPEQPKAETPAAPAMDGAVQAAIDQLKAGAAAMTEEQKTAAIDSIKALAEAAAKAAGADEAAVAAAVEAAVNAAKAAAGM